MAGRGDGLTRPPLKTRFTTPTRSKPIDDQQRPTGVAIDFKGEP